MNFWTKDSTSLNSEELRHSTYNSILASGDYLGLEGPRGRVTATWIIRIFCCKWKIQKLLYEYFIFGAEFMDCIKKLVQIFLNSLNATSFNNVETEARSDFGGMQRRFKRISGSNPPPYWCNCQQKRRIGSVSHNLAEICEKHII